MLHKKLDVPGTSGEFLPRSHLSYTAVSQGTEKCVSAAQNVQAGPSTWSQPMNPLLSQSTSGNKWTSSTQFTQPGPSGLLWTQSRPSSSKGADESMLIEIRGQQVRYRPSLTPPIAWDDSTFLNLEVSNEEPEKQQVTDNSDQKSSDECSEAKSQESESPEKKHGGGLFCKKGMPILAKLSPFKRHSVERDTMCSSKSDLVYHVTEKSSVSKPFFSFPTRIKAKSNPPSGVTSPTHEGGPEWQQRLDPDQREELCKVLSPEMKEKLNSGFFLPEYEKLLHLLYVDSETLRSLLSTSEGAEQVCSVLPPEKGKQLHSDLPFKTKKGLLFKFFGDEQEISRNVSTSSADSGLGKSLERGQSPSLIEKFNDKSLINSRVDSPNIKKYLQEGKEVFV